MPVILTTPRNAEHPSGRATAAGTGPATIGHGPLQLIEQGNLRASDHRVADGKNHVHNVLVKLRVNRRAEAAARLRERGPVQTV